jgi:prevent-host-death family protein
MAMQTIQASEAKTHFLRILDRVERGETVVISRRGRPIARIVPEVKKNGEDLLRAIAEMKALRQKIGRLSLEEILSARDEGRE